MSETNTGSSLFLTFRLGDELFALDVSQVREVLEFDTITGIPNALEFMRGVINVRGSVVPVIDLRAKFGMEPMECTVDTRIVVMELNLDSEMTVLGALADSVHEVIDLPAADIEPPPKIGSRWRTKFLHGIGKKDGEFILLLDIDKIFSLDELLSVQAHAGGEESQLQHAAV